ncbi:MAG: histone H1 [Bacteroidota bacterium]|nr:histone H1 [Bacteroidota bacterium]
MNKLDELTMAVKNLEIDFQKFYEKGQAAAGTRLRKSLSDIRKLAQDLRKDIQDTKTQRKEEKK